MPRSQVRPNLYRFAHQVAAHLPGTWTPARYRPDPNESDRFCEVWDSQLLEWAISEFHTDKAAVLTNFDGDRLLAMAHPQRATGFIIGALAIPGLGDDPVGDPAAPLAIVVPDDPVRAATVIARRFLPRYDEAVARVRLPSVTRALEGAERALAEWDAVSDSLCGPDGWPLDTDAYSERQSQRDAEAWKHLQTFLFHGPVLLADARTAMDQRAVHPQKAAEWRWRLGALGVALDGGRRIRAEWEAAHPQPLKQLYGTERQRHEDAVTERDADAWHYAHEFIAHGPVLLDIARLAATQPDAQASATARAEAARSRSTTAVAPMHTAAQAELPPSLRTSSAEPVHRAR